VAEIVLSPSQDRALKLLEGKSNLFLTGAAGTGKSTLLRQFLKNRGPKTHPVLASTGAAAILVGGRTLHSYFGLGILEGGVEKTVERAVKNKRLVKRLEECDTVIIDEISMISGPTLHAAERIARKARGNSTPWGGIRVIAVGDFSQLPPVNPYGTLKEWAFLDETWERTDFAPALLTEIVRTKDREFLEVLGQVRHGKITAQVREFLDHCQRRDRDEFAGTRLLPRREDVDRYNYTKLEAMKDKVRSFETEYKGKEAEIEKFRRNSPIGDVIHLKKNALVMIRQNDPDGRWVNGSLGHVTSIAEDRINVELLNGYDAEISKVDFTLLDAEGNAVVTATNFPLALAWAVTIHKAQGTTLDSIWLDLRRLWEPGQAYVALSRARASKGIILEGWDERSIVADSMVQNFYRSLEKSVANDTSPDGG